MNRTLTNLPAEGGMIEAYRGSPLPILFPFPAGYVVGTITALLQRNGVTLAATHQPSVSMQGQTASVELTGPQTTDLPANAVLVIYRDGVAIMQFAIRVSREASPVNYALEVPLRIGPDAIVVPVAITARGASGWTPQFRQVADGERVVMELYDWVGGELPKPPTGFFGAAGVLVPNIADGANIRGQPGASGSLSPEYVAIAQQIAADTLLTRDYRNQAAAMVGNVLTLVDETPIYLEVGIGTAITWSEGVSADGYQYTEITFN